MIVGSPVILGDEMDVSDASLTNLSFIVCSFWYVVGWSRWVLADLFGLLICLTFSGLELFHACSSRAGGLPPHSAAAADDHQFLPDKPACGGG